MNRQHLILTIRLIIWITAFTFYIYYLVVYGNNSKSTTNKNSPYTVGAVSKKTNK